MRDAEAGWRLHEEFIGEFPVEVCRFYVHLMKFKVALGSNREDCAEGCEFCDGGEGFVVIDAFDLREALRDNTGPVFLDSAIRSPLYAEG